MQSVFFYAEVTSHRLRTVADLFETHRISARVGSVLPLAEARSAHEMLNPLIMKQMVEHVPDAGSYAPVTILVDERPDGVHLSYDTMASYLTSYESPEGMKVAEDLDSKVRALITTAAG